MKAKSSILSLILNGKLFHVFNPWHIIVDFKEETITVKKRNQFLIGIDRDIIAFRYIRKVTIDEHLFGADIHIKVVGGNASAYCISKDDARKIKNSLMEYNQKKKGRSIIFS